MLNDIHEKVKLQTPTPLFCLIKSKFKVDGLSCIEHAGSATCMYGNM